MKMLAPRVGWALAGGHVFFTENGGVDWKNITPHSRFGGEDIRDVFFLDAKHGWVLFSEYAEPDCKFELAYTDSAGASWSLFPIKISGGDFSPGGTIAFADTRHGWMVIDLATSSAFRAGTLFLTIDGGRSWRAAPNDPAGQGPILMASPNDGWMAGGAEDEDLYVTHDGANSWQKVSLPAPKEVPPDSSPAADIPIFLDKKRGFVSVTYSGGEGDKSAAALFATNNGGRSWKPDRIITDLDETSRGQRLPCTVADSTWITAAVSDHRPVLRALGPNAKVRGNVDLQSHRSGYFQAYQLSFASPSEGWVVVGDGELLSTTDAGATWSDITPGPKRQRSEGHVPEARSYVAPTIDPTAEPSLAVSSGPSKQLGFDTEYVIPYFDMEQWWLNSPYYDVGFYVNGSSNGHLDTQLKRQWVTEVSDLGWGLWPIWVGLQSPCACKYGLSPKHLAWPHCSKGEYRGQFSRNATEAEFQGLTEALEAAGQLISLGLGGTLIYKDIEIYNDNIGFCKDATNAFLDGWVQGLHAAGVTAGVYESGSNATDLPAVEPDTAWIARGDNAATVFDFEDEGVEDYLFPNARMHQYISGNLEHMENYGGSKPYLTDSDIVDAPVIGGSPSQKPFPSSYTKMYLPATGEGPITYALAIANPFVGGGVGDIVGYNLQLGGPDQTGSASGFIYNTLSNMLDIPPTSLSCSLEQETFPMGINNLGNIVGMAVDSNGLYHAFLASEKNTTCLYPDSQIGLGSEYLGTYAINDAYWMKKTFPIGWLGGADPDLHYGLEGTGLDVYESLVYTVDRGGSTFSVSGQGQYSEIDGMNGLGDLVGNTELANFVDEAGGEDPSSGNIFDPINPSYYPVSINNNEDIAGYYFDDSGNSYGFVVAGLGSGASIAVGSAGDLALGINDYRQIVGATSTGGGYTAWVMVPSTGN